MVRRQVTIINKLGLHARAAAKFVTVASRYEADIQLVRDGKEVNAKSIMGVMMLAAAKGSRIVVETSGPDEAAAMQALTELVADRFGEDE